jgi:tetratricopeptide (TPR) repeat protein
MEKVVWIVLQGSSRGRQSPLLLFWFYITISGVPAQAADAETACRSPFARVVSIQGSVEVLRSGGNQWAKVARLDTSICPGDRLRTGVQSRAAVFVQPETLLRVDQNTSVVLSFLPDAKNQTAGETLVEFTQEEVVPVSATAHACGAGYFITRFPRKFKVKTPHLSAAVEGTEFLVSNRCESTDLSVIEGKVLVASAGASVFPPQSVVSGQTLTVGGAEPPAIKLLIKPADAVHWTLYYPPITPAGTVAPGDCSVVAQEERGACLLARAESFLRAGRAEEAEENINGALAAAPNNSDAKALTSIISLVKNDKVEALRLAKEAVDASPNSSPAWLALSYAQQADFKLEAALASAQRAAAIMPNALALARVAELQLSLGWTREAEKTAKQAVAANPSQSRAYMILGFVHLAQINVKEAQADFKRAIELDSTEPLSRLGLGLAIIRKGSLVEGREEFEIAVALDPTNSLLRSYLGKAYYEENTTERDHLAAGQFNLAKQFDPNDPTPWFYSGILKRSQNQPVESLKDLDQSSVLNDNRAVYRSRLRLDQDNAAKSASVATGYAELGFSQLALFEGYKAVTADPTNFAAHEFLATAYSSLPRHQISQVSELMQSQLRQPLRLNLITPEKSEAKLFIPTSSGSVPAGFNEWTVLTEKAGPKLLVDALAGGMGTSSGQATLAQLTGPLSMSAGAFSYRTDGFRENNDFHREIQNIFMQSSLTSELSAQFELRHSSFNFGDLPLRFDPQDVRTTRQSQDTESVRFGARYLITPDSDVVLSVINQSGDFSLTIPGFGSIIAVPKSTLVEAQGLSQFGPLRITLGASQLRGKLNETFLGFPNAETTQEQTTGYAYLNYSLGVAKANVQAAFGVTDLEEPNIKRNETSPKVGVMVPIGSRATLRAAYIKDVRRILPTNQTIEPTQIAGFSQFFDDVDGTIAVQKGVGLDYEFTRDTHAGLEYRDRDLTVPVIDLFLGTTRDVVWTEALSRAYLYWTPITKLAISTELFLEQYKRPIADPGVEGFFDLKSFRAPLTVSIFPNEKWFGRITATYWKQEGGFIDSLGAPLNASEDFVVFDGQLTYRFPRRRGALIIGANNIGNVERRYQEVDPANPRYLPQRFLYLKLSLVL